MLFLLRDTVLVIQPVSYVLVLPQAAAFTHHSHCSADSCA